MDRYVVVLTAHDSDSCSVYGAFRSQERAAEAAARINRYIVSARGKDQTVAPYYASAMPLGAPTIANVRRDGWFE